MIEEWLKLELTVFVMEVAMTIPKFCTDFY